MNLMKKAAAGALAGILALSMTACSSSNLNAQINAKLAQSGSSYTVTSLNASESGTVSLIQQAVSVYQNYEDSLVNTDDLADDLDDDGRSASHIASEVSIAKGDNRNAKANFDAAVAAFAQNTQGKVYTLTSAEVPQGLENEDAVADYVAGLITGNAQVYVSDVIDVPVLDDDEGTYTGNATYLRYVYIQYAQ